MCSIEIQNIKYNYITKTVFQIKVIQIHVQPFMSCINCNKLIYEGSLTSVLLFIKIKT